MLWFFPTGSQGHKLCPAHTSLICKDKLYPVAKMSASHLTWHLQNIPKGLGERVGMSQPAKKQIKDAVSAPRSKGSTWTMKPSWSLRENLARSLKSPYKDTSNKEATHITAYNPKSHTWPTFQVTKDEADTISLKAEILGEMNINNKKLTEEEKKKKTCSFYTCL